MPVPTNAFHSAGAKSARCRPTISSRAPPSIFSMAPLDRAGRFEDVNPAMFKMLGRSREEMVGRHLADFAPAEWKAFVGAQIGQPAGDRASWRGEFPLLAAD